MELAAERGAKTVSFPSISTGVYGYPIAEAADIALRAVIDFLRGPDHSIEKAVFVLFGESGLSGVRGSRAAVARPRRRGPDLRNQRRGRGPMSWISLSCWRLLGDHFASRWRDSIVPASVHHPVEGSKRQRAFLDIEVVDVG